MQTKQYFMEICDVHDMYVSWWQFAIILLCHFAHLLFQAEELKQMMHLAIINDRIDFVRLFVENGVSLKEFLKNVRLKLYYYNKLVTINDNGKTAFWYGFN